MSIIAALHRPDAYSLAIEFAERAEFMDANTEVCMWCDGFETKSWFFPVSADSLRYNAPAAQYAVLNTMPNIRRSPLFNANSEYPNCLIIRFNHEVEAGIFNISTRFLFSPADQAQVEQMSFPAFSDQITLT